MDAEAGTIARYRGHECLGGWVLVESGLTLELVEYVRLHGAGKLIDDGVREKA